MIFQLRFKPRLAITTSRSPPRRTRSFLTDLCLSIPGLTKIARGGKGFPTIIEELEAKNIKGLFIVLSKQGNPSRIDYYNLEEPIRNKRNIIPDFSFILSGVSLSREIGKKERPAFQRLIPPKSLPEWINKKLEVKNAYSAFVNVIKTNEVSFIDTDNVNKDENIGMLSVKGSRRKNLVNFSFIDLLSGEEVGPRIFVRNFKKLSE